MLNICEDHIDTVVNNSNTTTFGFLQGNNAGFFTADRLQSYAQTASNNGFDLGMLVGMFNGTCSINDKYLAEEFIYTAEAVFNPNFDKSEVRTAIANTKFTAQR